jgi:hypothetical protein
MLVKHLKTLTSPTRDEKVKMGTTLKMDLMMSVQPTRERYMNV